MVKFTAAFLRKWISNPLVVSMGFTIIGYGIVVFVMDSILGFNPLVSDVARYWSDSLSWRTPFNIYHVPFYALMIAFLRGITFSSLQPVTVMRIINFTALVINVYLVYRLLLLMKVHASYAAFGALVFSCWPFLGLTTTAYPLADNIGYTFFLSGLYFLLGSRSITAGLMFGIAIVSHKGVWPFIFMVIISWFITNWPRRSWKWPVMLIVLVLPFVILWLAGFVYYQNILWIFPEFYATSFAGAARTSLFSGLIQALHPMQLKDWGKGFAIIGTFLLALLTTYLDIRYRSRFWVVGLTISLICLIFFAIYSYDEQWYSVRFARLLVLPFFWNLSGINEYFKNPMGKLAFVIAVFLSLGLLASQIVFTWYLPYFHA